MRPMGLASRPGRRARAVAITRGSGPGWGLSPRSVLTPLAQGSHFHERYTVAVATAAGTQIQPAPAPPFPRRLLPRPRGQPGVEIGGRPFFPGSLEDNHPCSDYSLKKAECIAGVTDTHVPSVVWGQEKAGVWGEKQGGWWRDGHRETTGTGQAGGVSLPSAPETRRPPPSVWRGTPFPRAPWVFAYCRETSYRVSTERASLICTPSLCRSTGI